MNNTEMLTIKAAVTQLLEKAVGINDIETIPLAETMGRVIAQDVVSTINVPPADNSAMDGYAVHVDDHVPHTTHTSYSSYNTYNNTSNTKNTSTRFPISQTIAAGHPPQPLEKGTAARIFTGAEIPAGANAVVMQEKCTLDNSDSLHPYVDIPSSVAINNNIRQQGQDIRCGDTILTQGRKLQAQDMGLLASIGIAHVAVYRRLRVAILSTGDELIEPGEHLPAGKIYNSNRYLLRGLLQQLDIEVMDIGVIADTLEATVAGLQQAANADCIISTGGVSVGDEDHIKAAVLQLGELNFWRIAIKPGKPLAFGSINILPNNKTKNSHLQDTPFIGLPGNPASVFITFLLFARPFLLARQQQTPHSPREIPLTANFSWKENPLRQEYLRAKINTEGNIDIFPNQSSGVLSSTSWAEGLVVVPPKTAITIGDSIAFIPFREFF